MTMKMSTEVTKKRGRPKKAVLDSNAVKGMESIKKGTRQKSTKASAPPHTTTSNKSAKLSTGTPEGPSIKLTAIQKKTAIAKAPVVATNTASIPPLPTSPEAASGAVPFSTKSSIQPSPLKITPANSKILNQVRGLSSKRPSATKSSSATTNLPNHTPTSPTPDSILPRQNTTASSQTNDTPSSAFSSSFKPSPSEKVDREPFSSFPANTQKPSSSHPPPTPSISQSQTQQPPKSIPIAAFNSTIVSEISSRAGARPSRRPTALPTNYRPVAKKITLTIVALPIVIVTSWVLYQRLVLGEERKHLARPGMAMVEESPSMRERAEAVPEKGAS